MQISGELANLDAIVGALHRMANDDSLSSKVVNPPVRKALRTFQQEIQRVAPRQSSEAARRMRRYPRFVNFARLQQRIGMRFKGATKKRQAVGAAGVNAGFKRMTWAPHGPWTALGMKKGNRQTKAGHNRGLIRPMGYVSGTIARLGETVIAVARQETNDRYMNEATSYAGSPFRRR